MEKEKHKNIRSKLSENHEKYMNSFRSNIDVCMDECNMTIKQLAEKADIPYGTLNTFLYDKDAKDCKLSTAVKLAKAFGISIDELVGCTTMDQMTRESLKMFNDLPNNEKNVIRWQIRTLNREYKEMPTGKRIVNIMTPKCVNGSLEVTKEWERFEINGLPADIQPKVFMGFRVPCVHYMPVYNNGDILLVANDRKPINGEHCVIKIYKNLYITRCQRIGGKIKYLSIVGNNVKAVESDIDEFVGYVAHVEKNHEE